MTEGFKKIHDLMHDFYLIEDEGIIKLLCAAVVANRLPFDPVWLFLVAPSGGGKTEMIIAVNKVLGIYPISSLTSKTLISGFQRKGEETSLLFKVKNGIFTFKDFTSILSLHQEERKEVMGQFREIYDGSLNKSFGTGQEIRWRGKIGLIAGVTTIIHVARDLYAAMGERFVMYSPVIPDRKKMAERAMNNVEIIKEKREEIKDTFENYLDKEIGIPVEFPKTPEHIFEEIRDLAEFSTRARSPVDRDWRSSQKEITFVHTPEMPTRFAAQLITLTKAFMVMNNGKVEDLDRHILYKVALDSITSTRRKVLQELTRYNTVKTSGVATVLNYPTSTTRRWLEDLNALEMVDRVKVPGGDSWKIKDEYRKIVEKFEGIKTLDTELTEAEAEIRTDKVEVPTTEIVQAV